jgi:ElaB/YqjD/DUF883 family membrane-anchored ribosome-binding protein
MAEQSKQRADQQQGEVADDQFAVSEHAFLDRLNAQDSNETRERLEEMGEEDRRHLGLMRSSAQETAGRMVGQIEDFTRRKPLGALFGALVAGIVLGLLAGR